MKIRWKIAQNRAWRRVGPAWSLSGYLIEGLESLGSMVGASWERPGGIPEPEGDPTWTPGWAQNHPKINPKSHWFFNRFLSAILSPKWYQDGYPNHPKTVQKSVLFFDRFFIDFWIDLGGRNPWKWAPRVHEKLIFIKSPFPILTYFWKQKWWNKVPKMDPNWLKKLNQKIRSRCDRFWTYFWRLLGAFWVLKYYKKSSKKFSVFLEGKEWVLEPPVEIQGRSQGI